MLVLISQLLDRQVISFDDAETLGVIRDPIIDPANGKVVGYFFGHGLFNRQQSVLAAEDIVGYDESRVIVQGYDIARQPNEEPKIDAILKKKIPILSANVYTESGKHLGRANDLLLDTELGMVVKYYVHGLLNDRIIAADQVISIEKRGIIVNDMANADGAVAVEPANN